MKKAALILTMSFAFSALVCAGPEPIRSSGKEMKAVVAPMPPACRSWTGFYIGGFGGYKFASVETSLDLTGGWENPILEDDTTKIEQGAPNDLDASGGEVGGLLGYNFQWHCWVFGLEADGGYLWLRNSEDSGTISNFAHLGEDKEIRSSFRTHYLFTVAPRFGYAVGRWLPYVTGGLAVGDLDFQQELRNVPGSRVPYFSGGEIDDTRVGWMVGGGLQYALTDHWSVRGQYQYIDLGCVDFNSLGRPPVNVDFSTHHEACLREHNASFAIIYGF
jgi:outer membrane immunogenic protein